MDWRSTSGQQAIRDPGKACRASPDVACVPPREGILWAAVDDAPRVSRTPSDLPSLSGV